MDFSVDKDNSTVHVKREFNAPVSKVWSAWTEPEILDKWWAPKPWVSKTKSMEFKVGGQRLYAMCGPKGEEHWALADYTAITPQSNFKHLDAFCDSEGSINDDFPRSNWSVDFSPQNGTTLVHITIQHDNLEDLEKLIAMGFKEGFTSAMEGLDDVLSA
jgi:uncharacterized protein YndB with AHSA1/START domain